VVHTLAAQLPLAQSPFTPHGAPSGHAGQVPPQSVAVSLPFLTPSWQVGRAGFWQAAAPAVTTHVFPMPHATGALRPWPSAPHVTTALPWHAVLPATQTSGTQLPAEQKSDVGQSPCVTHRTQ
jgi:hypothetical protein